MKTIHIPKTKKFTVEMTMSEYEFENEDRTSFRAVEGLLLEHGVEWVGVRISNEKVQCAVSFTHPDLPDTQITRVGGTFYAAYVAAKAALHDALELQKTGGSPEGLPPA